MALGLIRTPRAAVRQPTGPIARINRHSGLSRGLVFAVIPTTQSRDVVFGRAPTFVSATPNNITGPRGVTAEFANNTSFAYGRDTALEPTQVTALAFVRRTGVLGAYSRPFGKTHSNGGSSPFVSYDVEYNAADAGQARVTAAVATGGSIRTTSATLIPSGDSTIAHLVGMSYANGDGLRLWCDGSNIATNAGATGAITYDTSTTGQFLVGGGSAAGLAALWAGDVYMVAVWDRLLSAAEHRAMFVNPWSIFGASVDVFPTLSSATFSLPPPRGGAFSHLLIR